MFKNLSVSFFSLVALMTFLGIFSLIQLDKVNYTSTEMAENWMPSVRVTQAMNTITGDIRIAEAMHILSISEEEQHKQEARLKETLDLLRKSQAEYEPLISSDEERAMYE